LYKFTEQKDFVVETFDMKFPKHATIIYQIYKINPKDKNGVFEPYGFAV